MNVCFWILPRESKWCPVLPERDISCAEISELKPTLADPLFWKANNVSIVLGIGAWARFIGEHSQRIGNNLICQDSKLGKIVYGQIGVEEQDEHFQNKEVLTVQENTLEELLKLMKKFWAFEDLKLCTTKDAEYELVEKIFLDTHYRDESGRFVVTIPLNPNMKQLGSSRAIALKRFLMLENRMERDQEFRENYIAFMREFEQLGHMSLADKPPKENELVYYIPHQGVVTSNKFRVVFDASCKTNLGISLNDIQLVGEKLQRDLSEHIMRFRRHKIAISADIKKMFRQVKIIPEQHNLQRIFWRENKNEPIQEYCLTVVMYGNASSPHCAVRAMIQGARLMSIQYPLAAHAIENDFYMDDGTTGANTIEEAIELAHDMKYVLSQSGFDLCKWKSNDNRLVKEMASENSESLMFIETESAYVLGLKWLTQSDEFAYELKGAEQEVDFTKRAILGKIMQLYDPNGFISPIITSAKVLMQKLWQNKYEWDAMVSKELRDEWIGIWDGMKELEKIRIPRWLGIQKGVQIQIRGFADASAIAYGAVIYIRVMQKNGEIHSLLLASKSRVAPLKAVTIPRLELAAAELLSKLFVSVIGSMELEKVPYFLWSDSSTALQWMRKDLCALKMYVANRVKVIRENSEINNWRHVRTHHNPADLISRGLNAKEIIKNELWWHGPSWLEEPEIKWPKQDVVMPLDKSIEINKELKIFTAVIKLNELQINGKNYPKPVNLLEYTNNLSKLLRIMSYVQRFVLRFIEKYGPNSMRKKRAPLKGKEKYSYLPSEEERSRALKFILRTEQSIAYPKEYNYLIKKQFNSDNDLPENSKIIPLRPFMCKENLIRAGGRISESECSLDEKHPIIMPAESRLSKLLLIEAHNETLHGHVQQMLQYTRQNYWIPNMRSAARAIVHRCVICARYNKKFENQLMANLPADRIQRNRAFLISGVDYAGPIELVERYKTRANKRKCWIAIFVCMVTRAMHIDIICDLSAAEFIACYERFVCKRGHCNRLYSDNGTSFVGAYKELKKAYEHWNVPAVHEHLNKKRTEWIFLKPSAPHQGGIYEAAVKSTKYHLKRVLGPKSYTYGHLITLLNQIEAILNSRPIYALSDDANDAQALTPAHFLIGEPFISPPPINAPNQTNNSLKRIFMELQDMKEQFWNRWHKEYVPTLIQRKKWAKKRDLFKLGQIVVIGDENLAPGHWLLGKIIKLIPSKDGLIRAVQLQTEKTKLIRPVQKLKILPVLNDSVLSGINEK